ncbi:transmembrane protein 272-like [Tautogolabrus adspersus]
MDESPQVEFRPQSAVLISTVVVITIMWWAVMIAAIALGATHLHSCPLEPNIPIYLIVFGVTSILSLTLTSTIKRWEKNSYAYILISSCMTLLHLFNFAWFIAGTCWVYPVYPPNYSPGGALYCHKAVYQLAFVFTTIVWVTIACTFICGCCFALLTCCGTITVRRRLIPNRGTFYGAIRGSSQDSAAGDV